MCITGTVVMIQGARKTVVETQPIFSFKTTFPASCDIGFVGINGLFSTTLTPNKTNNVDVTIHKAVG